MLTIADNRAMYSAYLAGTGLEIGALDSPLSLPKRATAVYADLCTTKELELKYPSLEPCRVDLVLDGTQLSSLSTGTYDFVVANHVIEHVPNVIGFLRDLGRVLKNFGTAYIAYPVPQLCPDRVRPMTKMSHFLADEARCTMNVSDEHRLAFAWAWHSETFADPDNIRSVLKLMWRNGLETLTPDLLALLSPTNAVSVEKLLATEDTSDMHQHLFSMRSFLACAKIASKGTDFELRPYEASLTKGVLSEHIFLFRKLPRKDTALFKRSALRRDKDAFAAVIGRERCLEDIIREQAAAIQEWRGVADARYDLIVSLQTTSQNSPVGEQ